MPSGFPKKSLDNMRIGNCLVKIKMFDSDFGDEDENNQGNPRRFTNSDSDSDLEEEIDTSYYDQLANDHDQENSTVYFGI